LKNQYFGDINDYRKYGLLRLIAMKTGLKIGICWMLTPDDGRTDGNKITYLSQPQYWRGYDPILYDFLKYCIYELRVREVGNIENERFLPSCVFHSAAVSDDPICRSQYFNDFKRLVSDCDLLFFDADNGMAVKSKPYGRKGSSKYLYWDEAKELYNLGFSLLVFQYHRRMSYNTFINRLKSEFQSNIGVGPSYFYRTPYVTLVLLAHNRHRIRFKEANKSVETLWRGQIFIIPCKDKLVTQSG